MAEGGGDVVGEAERGRLAFIAAAVARRPRRVVAAWVLLVALLGFLGAGLEDKLSTRAIFVDGTETKREHEIVVRQFGSETAVVVMLKGPRAQVERQGRELERWYDARPGLLVLSPWTPGATIEGLRPSPGVAALIVNVRGRVDDDVLGVLAMVKQGAREAVAPPVSVSIAGAPAIVDSIQKANEHAAEVGQWIAIPALLLVLLLVFRSVLAALCPVIVGGGVVVASRGVLDAIASVTHVEILALGAMGMMALALGVDYSLLIVSRYREELGRGANPADAIQTTITATGRTVLMAGSGLSLAMIVAALVLQGAVVTSVAIAIVVATALSVFSALLFVPALVILLGSNLDRWALPRREAGTGLAATISGRLASRPRAVALPIVLVLVFATLWAFTLETRVITVAQLPADDPGRKQQEAVQQELGAGWVAPLEIAMESRDGPVTTPARLKALADFERRLEKDPGVATMTGFAQLEKAMRQLGGFERGLAAQERGLDRLDDGLSRVHDGAKLNTEGLLAAADGARRLHSAIGATHGGAGLLARGLGSASDGSSRLASGLDRAGGGSGELADGTGKASDGAERLASGLDRARDQAGEIESNARVLESAMQTGEERLDEADAPIAVVESRLGEALRSLRSMGPGRADPQYGPTLEAVEAASLWLTGIDPASGEESDATEGAVAGIQGARGQFDLGGYLSRRLGKDGEKAETGIGKLARGATKLDSGLEKLETGARKMYTGIERLAEGGEALSPGLVRLRDGAQRLAAGLGQVQTGAGGLADGLGGGAHKSHFLAGALRKIDSGVERQRGEPGESQLDQLRRRSPGLFRSGFFYLASLDGTPSDRRRRAGFLVSVDHGGTAARMLVIPRFDPADPRASSTRARLEQRADDLARRTGTEVVVGGVTASQLDIDAALRDQTPLARLALALVTMAILVPVLRSLLVPFLAAILNLITVAATFGFLALLFDGSLLGGPGYVDTTVLPATIMVVFGLAIDYEVFVFSRMREEYLRTGSHQAAIDDGLARTAPVVTGAAIIMIVVFLAFAVSSFATMRNFGVAQAIGVAIDAFMIRLVVVPALMRALGKWSWWMPGWLDRLLPGTPNAVLLERGGAAR